MVSAKDITKVQRKSSLYYSELTWEEICTIMKALANMRASRRLRGPPCNNT